MPGELRQDGHAWDGEHRNGARGQEILKDLPREVGELALGAA